MRGYALWITFENFCPEIYFTKNLLYTQYFIKSMVLLETQGASSTARKRDALLLFNKLKLILGPNFTRTHVQNRAFS